MNLIRCLLLIPILCSVSLGDTRIVILVTPKGVYQTEVVDGIPGNWSPANVDVIVQGFGSGPNPPNPDPPNPPVEDPIVRKVSEISKKLNQQNNEPTAVAALVDSLAKLGLSTKDFVESLEMAAPIADTSIKAGGRITQWVKEVLAVTSDPVKIRAGIRDAWTINESAVELITDAAEAPKGAAVPQEALEWTAIIQIIQMILTLLRDLGILK